MTIKTAISIDDSLYEKANELASELNLSRSRFFALAVQEFIERYENQRLLDAINAAYPDAIDEAERNLLQQHRVKQREMVEGEW